MLCPIILGSDKTTVSVATGHIEYHPLYLSIGNPHNALRHAHRNAVIHIAFLAIPKCKLLLVIIRIGALMSENSGEHGYDDSPRFQAFKRQLYHASIAAILRPLHPGMMKPVVRRYPDGHFRHIIYDLIAFIADYPEQVMLTGIVQGWCPK